MAKKDFVAKWPIEHNGKSYKAGAKITLDDADEGDKATIGTGAVELAKREAPPPPAKNGNNNPKAAASTGGQSTIADPAAGGEQDKAGEQDPDGSQSDDDKGGD